MGLEATTKRGRTSREIKPTHHPRPNTVQLYPLSLFPMALTVRVTAMGCWWRLGEVSQVKVGGRCKGIGGKQAQRTAGRLVEGLGCVLCSCILSVFFHGLGLGFAPMEAGSSRKSSGSRKYCAVMSSQFLSMGMKRMVTILCRYTLSVFSYYLIDWLADVAGWFFLAGWNTVQLYPLSFFPVAWDCAVLLFRVLSRERILSRNTE